MILFPIGDENPSSRTPYVTYGIIAVNSAVFLLVNRFGGLPMRVALDFGFVPAKAHWYTYFTCLFLHGDILHVAGNMLFLWITGDNVEDKLGHLPFLGFYLLSGVFADLAYTVFSQVSAGGVPLIGASGAIAGVLGAYMFFFPRARIRVFYWFWFFFAGTFRVEARWAIGFWIVENLFLWLVLPGTYVTGVAYAAHVGGFAVGILAGLLLKPRLRGTRASAADRLTGFAGPGRRPAREPGGRVVDVEAAPRRPEFVPPRVQRERDGKDFFGLEEAIAENVKNGRMDAALDRYAEYVRMRHVKPLLPWAQIEIAGELFRLRDYEGALKAYRRYLAVSPTGPDAAEAKFRLGVILARQRKEYFRAREYLLQAAMEHPDPEIVRFAREELRRIEGKL